MPWLSLQLGLRVDVGGINPDVVPLGVAGIDIYSGMQKMCGGRVARLFRMRIGDTPFATPFVGGRLRHSDDSGITGTQRREDDDVY